MKSLQKRLIAFCMTFLLMIMLIPNVAYASGKVTKDNGKEGVQQEVYDGTCGENVTYHYDGNGTLIISGTGPMANYDAPNPQYPGDPIYDSAPWNSSEIRDQLTKVVIEEGVTTIGSGAFLDGRITEVRIPNTVTRIENEAFYNCNDLQQLTIPDSVTYMGDYVFAGCSNLKTVSFSKGMTCIPKGTFFMSGLEAFEVPEHVENIDMYAFYSCQSLEKMVIPKTVTYIADEAMLECRNITIYGAGGSEADRYASYMGYDFVAENKCKVTYKDEDGTVIMEQMVPYGGCSGPPSLDVKIVDERTIKVCVDWQIESADSYDSTLYCVTSDMVVTPVYQEYPRTYTVTFDANGGKVSGSEYKHYDYEEKLGTLPTCTRDGYTFQGWYTKATRGKKVAATTQVTGEMTLYAHWKKAK